jgi:hypothetical protein
MPAFWAPAEFDARGGGVQRVTPNTVEDGLASFALKAPMIPAIIVKPQREKYRAHEDAVDDSGGGEFEHPITMVN